MGTTATVHIHPHFKKVVQAANADYLSVPNTEMQFITGMLQFLVPHQRFRGYSYCIVQEYLDGKMNIYLGAAFRRDGALCVSSQRPLVHFQYSRKGNDHIWQASYRGMSPLQTTDFSLVMEHVRKQIAQRENIRLETIPAYESPRPASLPYTPKRGGKNTHLRVV